MFHLIQFYAKIYFFITTMRYIVVFFKKYFPIESGNKIQGLSMGTII